MKTHNKHGLVTVVFPVVLFLAANCLAQPVITSIAWDHAGNYVVSGTVPNNYTGQVTIKMQPGNIAIANGTSTNGRFSINCNPNLAPAGTMINASATTEGAGPEVLVPRMGAKKVKSKRRTTNSSACPSGPEGSLDVRTSYFDAMAPATLSIQGVALRLPAGPQIVRVRTTTDGLSGIGRENTPTAWTTVVVATVNSSGPSFPAFIPSFFDVPLLTNTPRGMAVECVSSSLRATAASPSQGWSPTKPYFSILAGDLQAGSPASSMGPGIFEGEFYVAGPATSISGAWQENQPLVRLDIDGLESDGLEPAVLPWCGTSSTSGGPPHTLYLDVQPGALFDVAITLAPAVPYPGFPSAMTSNGQLVNIDITSPTLFFLNSGTAVPALRPSPGIIAVQIPNAPSFSFMVTFQAVLVSPSYLGLSQITGFPVGI